MCSDGNVSVTVHRDTHAVHPPIHIYIQNAQTHTQSDMGGSRFGSDVQIIEKHAERLVEVMQLQPVEKPVERLFETIQIQDQQVCGLLFGTRVTSG